MNLLYYRVGFASNSSSLHSTWHVEDASKIRDIIIDGANFGWDFFVCASKLEIEKYLAAQIKVNIEDRVPEEVIVGLIRQLFPKIKPSDIEDMNIDHQSIWGFPKDLHSKNDIFPSIKFIRDLKKYLIKTNTVIVGGNDNEESVDVKSILGVDNIYRDTIIPETIGSSFGFVKNESVCVKDGPVWKVFDRENGKKMRFSFVNGVSYEKSSDPELIDLIITNKCSHGCPYCYRGCNIEQKEAPLDRIQNVLWKLLEYNDIFEIAIGGGNILEYSLFYDLCDLIKSQSKQYRTVFNTTINCKDFKDENIGKIVELFSTFRGIAVSISNAEEIEHVIKYLKENHIVIRRGKLSFQCIPELMTYKEIKKISDQRNNSRISYNITFLGFKHTGRGISPQYSAAEFEKNKDEFRKFIQDIKSMDPDELDAWYAPRMFGIDTELIHNFPELKESQASWMYDEYEGKFSCCIDLVDNYVLPSSYSEYKDEYKVPPATKSVYGNLEIDISRNVHNFLEEIYPKF